MHQQNIVLEKIAATFKENKNNIALLVTGSVARGEAGENSDLDLLLVTKHGASFEEFDSEGVLVEIKSNTLQGFKEKMDESPMNIYQFLDAKLVLGLEDTLSDLQTYASKILENYKSAEIPQKWLQSAKKKIVSAQEAHDELNLGFQTSNILWKIVEGFFALNSQPLPPNTTAFRRITLLPNLPAHFEELWKNALTGDLEGRSLATLKLIDYLVN